MTQLLDFFFIPHVVGHPSRFVNLRVRPISLNLYKYVKIDVEYYQVILLRYVMQNCTLHSHSHFFYLMSAKYIVHRVQLFVPHLIPISNLIQLSTFIHVVCMYCICFNHVNLLSNMIPRNFTSLTISSICVPIFNTSLPMFFLLEKIIHSSVG